MVKKQIEIPKDLKDDIKGVLDDKAAGLVEDWIFPTLAETLAEYTGSLTAKLSTIDVESDEQYEYAFNEIHRGLTDELIRQLRNVMYDPE